MLGMKDGFQSTLSVRRATWQRLQSVRHFLFQSTLSVRRATKRYWMVSRKKRFQSTLSVRRATLTSQIRHANNEFQSTLSVRRATNDIRLGQSPIGISIHALRKESDALRRPHRMGQDISIHALRKESDGGLMEPSKYSTSFQSTLSVRRATQQCCGQQCEHIISIHALRKESDSPSPARHRY